jgi:thioredoxin reductase
MNENENYDVIIIGGSYAGLSAAMSLGRSLRNILIIDNGKPCNASTPHSHNFLTQDGETPSEIARIGKAQLENYQTVHFLNDLAVSGRKTTNGFQVVLQSGKNVFSKKIIFATGIKDQLLNIRGFSDCWGISVIHCPYCHGYEFNGKRTAILGSGETAMHYALLVSNLTGDLTILTNGGTEFSEVEKAKLGRHNIIVVQNKVVEIEHDNGHIRNVVFNDGDRLPFGALYYKPPFTQHSDIPQALGCELTEQGYIKIDSTQKTSVEGVFACGDNSSMMRSVANAVAAGNFTGAVVNKELATEWFETGKMSQSRSG